MSYHRYTNKDSPVTTYYVYFTITTLEYVLLLCVKCIYYSTYSPDHLFGYIINAAKLTRSNFVSSECKSFNLPSFEFIFQVSTSIFHFKYNKVVKQNEMSTRRR